MTLPAPMSSTARRPVRSSVEKRPLRWLTIGLLLLTGVPVAAAEREPAPRTLPHPNAEEARVIVAYKPGASVLHEVPLPRWASRNEVRTLLQRRAERLARRAQAPLESGRALSERSHVIRARGLSSVELARRIAADPEVAYAVPDGRKRALMVPNDPLYAAGPGIDLSRLAGGPVAGQWYLRPPTADLRSAINATDAWNFSSGQGVVVAVLDSGVLRDHPDLQANLLAGYDFISDVPTANDGDGRDGDATDTGDWITQAENASGPFKDCGEEDSSWHGTKVSGIIAAATHNGLGMAGIAHGARLLPVRVLGKCGGYDSDIQAAMRWSAGLPVPGVPANTNPARVVNLSLGSSGSCTTAYRETVAELTAAGAIVIAAAGNSTGRTVGTPANCAGVIAVAGLRHAGTKVGFSDLGPQITIAAPGGNCVNTTSNSPCLYPIVTTTNSGTRQPLAGSSTYTDSFDIAVGTSFAAPIVSGTVALMLAAQPGLLPSEVTSLLRATARAFPASGADNGPTDPTPVPVCQPPGPVDQLQCYCTTELCGAGMLDAAAAARAAAQGVFVRIGVTPATPQAGAAITLTGEGTLLGAGRSIAQWSWTLLNPGGIVSGFTSATNAATATMQPTGVGTITVRLTVTDDLGRTASADSSVGVSAPTVSPPPPTGGAGTGGGSGGGMSDPRWLLGLVVAALMLNRARRDDG